MRFKKRIDRKKESYEYIFIYFSQKKARKNLMNNERKNV